MKMRGLADQLVTWMLILLVIFTGTTLAQLDREQLLVQIRANISKINDGKTVSQNDTYLLLDHDYYFQEDFIDGAIDKDVLDKTIRPNFQMKLFGTEYDAVDVHANGAVLTQNSKERVIIEPLVNGFGGEYMHSVQTVKIIIVLYKNGIITMKYEENAVMNEQNKGNSLLSASNSNSTETTTTSPEKTSKQQQEATTEKFT
ncbi:plexin domain containing 2 precursor [Schistosoma japonicum]|nr:plexin domain containing 2 precursor [Schistosoma japonicum]